MTSDPTPDPAASSSAASRTPRWLRTLSRGALVAMAIAALFMAAPMVQGLYFAAFPSDPVPADQLPDWREGFDTALVHAADTGKPVLIDFTAAWCPPCKVMEARVWPNQDVRAAIEQRVIPLKLDVDQPASEAAALRYGIQSIPTVVLVDAAGRELARGGYMSAQGMTDFIESHTEALPGGGTDS